MERFKGKVILITGAGSGIGRAAALAFAREGGSLILGSRGLESGGETASLAEAVGGRAIFLATDVGREEQVEELVRKGLETYGALHCAFLNAGILGTPNSISQETERNIDAILSTNIKGAILGIKHAARAMQSGGGGSIVLNSSISGLKGIPMLATYSASKAALMAVARSAARELSGNGIRVNCIAPGAVRTEMLSELTGGHPEILIPQIPLGRLATPQQVAAAALWLCSEESSYVTGQTLPVDGGMTA